MPAAITGSPSALASTLPPTEEPTQEVTAIPTSLVPVAATSPAPTAAPTAAPTVLVTTLPPSASPTELIGTCYKSNLNCNYGNSPLIKTYRNTLEDCSELLPVFSTSKRSWREPISADAVDKTAAQCCQIFVNGTNPSCSTMPPYSEWGRCTTSDHPGFYFTHSYGVSLTSEDCFAQQMADPEKKERRWAPRHAVGDAFFPDGAMNCPATLLGECYNDDVCGYGKNPNHVYKNYTTYPACTAFGSSVLGYYWTLGLTCTIPGSGSHRGARGWGVCIKGNDSCDQTDDNAVTLTLRDCEEAALEDPSFQSFLAPDTHYSIPNACCKVFSNGTSDCGS